MLFSLTRKPTPAVSADAKTAKYGRVELRDDPFMMGGLEGKSLPRVSRSETLSIGSHEVRTMPFLENRISKTNR